MASLERDAVESSLKKKGFVVEERDHRYFMLYAEWTVHGDSYQDFPRHRVQDTWQQSGRQNGRATQADHPAVRGAGSVSPLCG